MRRPAGIEVFPAFAREMADFGTVNCIAPGPIDTDLLRGVSQEQIARLSSTRFSCSCPSAVAILWKRF